MCFSQFCLVATAGDFVSVRGVFPTTKRELIGCGILKAHAGVLFGDANVPTLTEERSWQQSVNNTNNITRVNYDLKN